jgi:hypothetical protein
MQLLAFLPGRRYKYLWYIRWHDSSQNSMGSVSQNSDDSMETWCHVALVPATFMVPSLHTGTQPTSIYCVITIGTLSTPKVTPSDLECINRHLSTSPLPFCFLGRGASWQVRGSWIQTKWQNAKWQKARL